MNTFKNLFRIVVPVLIMLVYTTPSQSQFIKKLGKAAERAAKNTVENRVERETQKKTDAAMDSILEPGSNKETQLPIPQGDSPGEKGQGVENNPNGNGNQGSTGTSGPKTLSIYTNYDFAPGDRVLLYDDFSVDNVGDFPAKWNTNGSGEVVTLDESPEKWLKLSDKTIYVPDLPGTLPNDYTIEFDIITTGLDRNTSSTARLTLLLEDNNSLRKGSSFAQMGIPLAQYTDPGIYVYNYFNGQNTVSNYIKKDIRNEVLQLAHVAVAVNGQRFRMWMNESKLVDLPRFIEPGAVKYMKFNLNGMPSEKTAQFVFITNIKLAEGGEDLRGKLLKDGKFSTTGILFDSGSDKIKPESYGTLKRIAEALQQEAGIHVKIIGHTDADGSDGSNLELSKKRAASVMNALTNEFEISESRFETDGKGESDPVADNATTAGKAQNRRVEFIKV